MITQTPLVIDSTKEDKTSELFNPDTTGQYIRIERVDGLNRKAVALQVKEVVIPLNKEITKGIHSVSARFEKSNKYGSANADVGIAKESFVITCPCNIDAEENYKSLLYYFGSTGKVYCKDRKIEPNSKFSDDQLITMELNADLGTLHFFVDGIQQPAFVSGIKESVKFYYLLYQKDSSVTIVSVKQLSAPTIKKLANERAIYW
ncbi:MAG: hypothetical protein EZS28_021799 [Streblomastix strix]|uniref:SPRY domain-containing protein n=1 Tax=Streblomastix strix TaxID=222440 RepID=A0A5J4VKD8_9EUKA|nr:MAG: hypothetical protein EZS28_021799 [Streblomastix strix]